MKLLEYEAKAWLREADISVPASSLLYSANTFPSTPVVLKSQVPVGGRGKAGGIVVVEDDTILQESIEQLFKLSIKGFRPTVILAEEKLAIKKELYLSLSIDRERGAFLLMAHTQGGVEVESNNQEGFLRLELDRVSPASVSKKLARFFSLPLAKIEPLVIKLLDLFVAGDMLLLEINPLILTQTNQLVAGDCKIEVDNAAAFRHPDWDFEDKPSDNNFVTLNPEGQIATIANGAGLAMATVDAVQSAGLTSANFLDIGGGASADTVLGAFKKIVEYPHVQAIVINIFAGITRCDEVAKAIITAKAAMPELPPLCIRLAGTNFEEAVAMLTKENIPTLATLEECLTIAKGFTHE